MTVNKEMMARNEQQANNYVSWSLALMVIIIGLVWLLAFVGIFAIDPKTINVFMSVLLPIQIAAVTINGVLKGNKPWIKYMLLVVSVMMVGLLDILLTTRAHLLLLIPLLLSCHYYSMKFSMVVGIITIFEMVICCIEGVMFGVIDLSTVVLKEGVECTVTGNLIESGITRDMLDIPATILNSAQHMYLPTLMCFCAIAPIIYKLSTRANNLLAEQDVLTNESSRISTELNIAENIQRAMLPKILPTFPNRPEMDIYASMHPAKEVGGDFYDFYFVGPNKFAFIVADVSGKGVPAAMFMMYSKTIIKGLAETGMAVNSVFTRANQRLCENNTIGMFVTCWMGVIDLETGLVTYSNAGHNAPVIRRAGGKFEFLNAKRQLVMAGMDNTQYTLGELQLNAGDTICLYTDGITEAADSKRNMFGNQRFLDALNRDPDVDTRQLCKNVHNELDEFVGDAEQFDDMTMLNLRYNGPSSDEIHVDAIVENVVKVTDFVNAKLETLDCPIKAQTQIDIAIDEMFGNIAQYAYNPEVGPATVRVEVEHDPLSVIITFLDHGIPYNPLEKADPNTKLSAEEREMGGLGIFLVKKTMDDISYEYKDGQNILRIKKNL